MILNKIIELMQLQFDGRALPQILIDWQGKIDDIVRYEYQSIGKRLDKMGLSFELKDCQKTDEEGYSYYVIKIIDQNETAFIKLEAMNSSYDGPILQNWHEVKPVEVTKTEYQRV